MSSKQNILKAQDNGDFISWKKNIPIFYQAFVGRILEWSSLTCQFLSSIETADDQVLKQQQILFGTNNPKKEDNNLLIANIRYYNQSYKENDAKQKLHEIFDDDFKSIHVENKIPHKGPVLKAKAKQQNKNFIATRSSNNIVYVYNLQNENQENPLALKEHQMQGYTLDWKKETFEIITSSFDGQICLWDINRTPKQDKKESLEDTQVYIEPMLKFDYNFKPVTDLKFHKFQQNFFGYTTDHHIVLQDSREGIKRPFWSVLAHIDETTTLDFSPHDQFLLLSGAKTGRVKLWDMRKMNTSLIDLQHCQEEVLKVEWSPNLSTVFASSSSNNQIKLWDLSRIDLDSKKQKLEFLNHSGHKGVITDFDWNEEQELSLLSTDSKNQLHYWQVKQDIYHELEQLYNNILQHKQKIIMEENPYKKSLILFTDIYKTDDIIQINIYDTDKIKDRFQYGIKERHVFYSDWWFDFYEGQVEYPLHFQLFQKFWNFDLQCLCLGGYLMDNEQDNRQLALENYSLQSTWKRIGNFVYLNCINLSQCYLSQFKIVNWKEKIFYMYRDENKKIIWDQKPNGTLLNFKICQKNKQISQNFNQKIFL